MTKKEKLFQKLLSKNKDLRYEELKKILEMCGYSVRPGKGSHTVFIKPNHNPITIPHQQPIKSYIIRQVLLEIEDCISTEE